MVTIIFLSSLTVIILLSVLYSLSMVRRLTYKQELEKEARIFNANPYPVLKTDRSGTIVQCNNSAKNLIGYSMTGMKLSALIPGFDAEKILSDGKDSTVQFEQTFGETQVPVFRDRRHKGKWPFSLWHGYLKS